jgi:tetratricopeptide (TPR) repeat protein
VAFFDRLRRLLPGRAPDAVGHGGTAFGGTAAFDRGTKALERGRLDQADAAFEEALRAAATAAQIAAVRNKRAIVAIRRLGLERAVDELTLALEADPRSAAALTTIGNLLLEGGAVDDAIAHYEYAVLVDDTYAPAYHNLGVALHRSGRRGEAVRMLRKATRLESRMKLR